MTKAPGGKNHWHCTREELLALEAATKLAGKRLGMAGLYGVYDPAQKTYQIKDGKRFSGCYRVYA